MKNLWLILLTAVLAFGLTSCHSKRSSVRDDYTYGDYSSEEFILQELQQSLQNAPQATAMLLAEAYKWRGTPYRYGGHSRSGTDCSGFVMEVFDAAVGIKLPRNSAKQSEHCTKIKKSDLEAGDLVFFATGKAGKVNHVGLYVGDGSMIHASTHGVMVSSIDEPYFRQRFLLAGRVPAFADLTRKQKKKKK